MDETLREDMDPAVGVACVAGGGVVHSDIIGVGRVCWCLLALLSKRREEVDYVAWPGECRGGISLSGLVESVKYRLGDWLVACNGSAVRVIG